MIIKQVSVFLENKSGRLTEVLTSLGKANINITSLSIADTSEYGILRLIVNDPEKAHQTLKSNGFSVNLTEVLSIASPPAAGSFARVLEILSQENISVEYIYAFSTGEKAVIVLRTENVSNTITVLQKHKLELIKASELYDF